MEEKKADNKIYEAKKEIERLDEQIYNNQKSLEKLDELEESFAAINVCLNKCVELVNKSIKGRKVNRRMDEISIENKVKFTGAVYTLDDERRQLRDEINKLNDRKDEAVKEMKKEISKDSNNKEENKKEEEKNN